MKNSPRLILLLVFFTFTLSACNSSSSSEKTIEVTETKPVATAVLDEKIPVTDDNEAIIAPDYVGCEDAAYPDWETSLYILPYSVGETYSTRLTNCSSSYHAQGTSDQFAFDFAMPVGTLITASRAGKVVFVEQGGKRSELNNLVIIDNGDNTFGEYMHLQQDGALVEVGDVVEQGDEIGLSGVTGLAGYPHLHLIVTKDGWDWPYTGVPITFRNTVPNPYGLETNGKYPALPYQVK